MKWKSNRLDELFDIETDSFEEEFVFERSGDYAPWNKGVPHTEETKELISKKMKGRPSPHRGIKRTPEMNAAKSKAMTGKKRGPYKPRKKGLSEETKQKHRENALKRQRGASGQFINTGVGVINI